ncbi:chromosome segregation protein SMC [Alteromonas sp. a30]|uniref:chromosome segregation protein SMC n=1 Tax=Alteromonas sp. a30 TaxID=2730917 RepID=UPI0022822421|nr:chromosome segregation protein SMC [Alteromonas sp. a30]MCY7293949.1 chromosome segregation protein SMC [Alteromonas sp. a30]
MRLKKIRLAGFKSFVDPTNIPFPDDMTAIVGPNGCGKSNVIDAVRWVLGESSAKNLRGDAMTDVIFNGSSVRKPVSQCSVELVFDNSSGRIHGEYAGYNELSVKRVVTRDATSTYYLNGTKCRRRDVTDLFLGTGLGPRSYAIIEQGMISRLIESKPQELRVFIEEAAGISKYKERRRETENRIRHTRENLERLEDVRLELGQQLEKLQRQASAAKRYKELKAKERQYKAELAAIKWLKHSNIIADLETRIEQQESDIQGLIAQQRGDETNIIRYREEQADLKQQLDDIQKQNFNLATDITRIEQSQIHNRQRTQQVAKDIQQAQETVGDITLRIESLAENVETLALSLEEFEPRKALLLEQQESAEALLAEKETAFHNKQSQWRQEEQAQNQLKQKIQSIHGQIQSGLQMQLRTEQRIAEIKEEIESFNSREIEEELTQLRETEFELQETLEEARILEQQETDNLESVKSELDTTKVEQQTAYQAWQKQSAKLSSLQDLHAQQSSQGDDIENWLTAQTIKSTSIWDYLQVESGWENAVEVAMQQWQNALVIEHFTSNAKVPEIAGIKLFFEASLTPEKNINTLAGKCSVEQVPDVLNQVFIANDTRHAQQLKTSLLANQSVITQDGYWLGPDWFVFGADKEKGGALARLNEIKQLQTSIEASESRYRTLSDALETLESRYEQAIQAKQKAKSDLTQVEVQYKQAQTQAEFLQQQLDRQSQKKDKLMRDLSVQEEQIELEQEQLEELNIQIAELEEQQNERDDDSSDIELQRERMQNAIDDLRITTAQYQNQLHQLELQLQSQRNQYQSEQANLERDKAMLSKTQEQLALLKEEQETLTLPMEEQAEKLEGLLEKRSELLAQQERVSDALAEVESVLLDFEKGREGVQSRIEKAKEAQQSTRVECEGYKARASAVLEQLQEMQQPLKSVLENLTEDADEQEWQSVLDKTSASLSRLGAVNLAAVEEYEIQAERKHHLDEQNDDLVAALETLENAIRKIDKETRARFRETFEQVNNDLKQLFPKVFGGGSAYLDLTEDDLLDTGVTIMARPPGKKNSTIHLLSGGEKALTALSLVFAIFRLNPAPFCLLDEVDAPLDDANVGRFCKLVSEMSKSVQFIYITHNKIAMEMALHLTGVTMAEPGVSRVVAVDVEEAVAIVNA